MSRGVGSPRLTPAGWKPALFKAMRTIDRSLTRAHCLGKTGSQEVYMPRATTTITFSLPPEMAERVDEVTKQEGRSRSELLREALLHYFEGNEWRQLLRYGERQVKAQAIGPEDVDPQANEQRGLSQPVKHRV